MSAALFQCVCVAHTEFALRWVPAGSLSADAHLHRDLAEGMGEHRQTCTHKQTDEYARAKHGEMSEKHTKMSTDVCNQVSEALY